MRPTAAAALFALILLPATAGAQAKKEAPAGGISREAYIKNDVARAEKLAARRFNAIDTAHKGVITRQQYIDYYEKSAARLAGRRFDRMDTDHNGILEPSEIEAWRAAHPSRRAPSSHQ
jgi:DNA-binding transcriptional regulator YdaS (Cro superfamily)